MSHTCIGKDELGSRRSRNVVSTRRRMEATSFEVDAHSTHFDRDPSIQSTQTQTINLFFSHLRSPLRKAGSDLQRSRVFVSNEELEIVLERVLIVRKTRKYSSSRRTREKETLRYPAKSISLFSLTVFISSFLARLRESII